MASMAVDTTSDQAYHYEVQGRVFKYPGGHNKKSWQKMADERHRQLEKEGYAFD